MRCTRIYCFRIAYRVLVYIILMSNGEQLSMLACRGYHVAVRGVRSINLDLLVGIQSLKMLVARLRTPC